MCAFALCSISGDGDRSSVQGDRETSAPLRDEGGELSRDVAWCMSECVCEYIGANNMGDVCKCTSDMCSKRICGFMYRCLVRII